MLLRAVMGEVASISLKFCDISVFVKRNVISLLVMRHDKIEIDWMPWHISGTCLKNNRACRNSTHVGEI